MSWRDRPLASGRFAACMALLVVSVMTPAHACPLCDSETGDQVREELAGHHLGISIAATVAPFALLGGVVAIVHLDVPSTRRRR